MFFKNVWQHINHYIYLIEEQSSWRLGLLICLAIIGIYWSGVLQFDATPYGDGSRIMPFIRMFDHNPAWFPFWSYRNGGEPILASPEHFYFLGYLLDWGSEYSNIIIKHLLILHADNAW